MAMKITCPHCKRGMLVPESMAGKKGRCKACQQILTVPGLPASSPPANGGAKPAAPRPTNDGTKPAPPRPARPAAPAAPRAKAPPPPTPPPPPAPADDETAAAALLADEAKPVEKVEVKVIELNCPFCDEPIKFPVDLAGKRAPCPECTHIIKVPEPAVKDPTDWRKKETRGPSGARQAEQPELEGAWGSTKARGVGTEALVEAGVIPEKQRPRTTWQKIRLPVLSISLLLVLVVGGVIGYRWWSGRAADRALQEAQAFASSPEAGPPLQAALSMGAAEYFLRTQKADSAENANKQFGQALNALRSVRPGSERDTLLSDLALALVELGGDKPEADAGQRMPWDKTQALIQAALRDISDTEARLQALRPVVRRLRDRGQSIRILPLTNQVFGGGDPDKNADKAAALAIVALEFRKAGDQPSADRAAKAALDLYEDKKAPPLRAEVVALALLLDKKAPAPGEHKDDRANEYLGKIEALARQGEWAKAREKAALEEFDEVVRFRARLAIAAAAVDAQVTDTDDIEAALKAAEGGLGSKAELSWLLLRLTRLALATPVSVDRVQAVAGRIGNSAVRGRAQLAVFRSQMLKQSKEAVEESAIEKIDAKSMASLLAAMELARHNTRLNNDFVPVVQGWPQPRKAFGSLGVALGLQDRKR